MQANASCGSPCSTDTVLGVALATLGSGHFRSLRAINLLYVWTLQGTPALLQVLFLFYGLPLLFGIDTIPRDIDISPWAITGTMIAGIVGLGLNEAAYMSKIVREGFESVDIGQIEAARSSG